MKSQDTSPEIGPYVRYVDTVLLSIAILDTTCLWRIFDCVCAVWAMSSCWFGEQEDNIFYIVQDLQLKCPRARNNQNTYHNTTNHYKWNKNGCLNRSPFKTSDKLTKKWSVYLLIRHVETDQSTIPRRLNVQRFQDVCTQVEWSVFGSHRSTVLHEWSLWH